VCVVREKTNIPVPNVLAWSVETETGPVGAEYMIMDAVPGVPLKDVWSQMTGLQHIQCIESLGKIAKELCSLDFAAFGSLYLNTANMPTEADPLDGKYCIGPHCARQHWGCGVDKSGAFSVPRGCQGPCESVLRKKYYSLVLNLGRAEPSSILLRPY